jgi:hypothetical protein
MRILNAVLLVVCSATALHAQSFEAGTSVAASAWSEFDGADKGIGGRFGWKPIPLVGVEADLTWYPSDFVAGRVPFSRQRIEGVFGATVGPELTRLRPFAKAAAGFLKVSPTSGAFACIAIFPPPLACLLVGGDTLPVFEMGGGVTFTTTSRTFLRADLGYRFLKYPGPTFDSDFQVRDEGWWAGAPRCSFGAGIRF